jgi:hypothetical protein
MEGKMGNRETRTEELRSDYESVTTDAPLLTDPADGDKPSDDAANNGDTGDSATPGDSSAPDDGDKGDNTDAEDVEAGLKPDSDEDDTPPDKDKKKPGRFQKKINNLTRKTYELERENADLKARLKKPASSPGETKENKKPVPDDFENYEAYNEALLDWKLEDKLTRETQKQDEDKRLSQQKEIEQTFYNRLEKYSNEHEDFFELVIDNKDLKITPNMFQAVMDSEHAPEILHELGKNPDEAARIAKLSPVAVIREIGRIEAKFIKPPDPPKKKLTDAPPPIEPIGGNKKGEKKPEDMGNEEYRRWRRGEKS